MASVGAAGAHGKAKAVPYAGVNGLRLYYELHGSDPRGMGAPLCLVEGTGYATWMWHHQVGPLAARHRVLIYDNRDAGLSDQVEQPYTIRDMAADLRGLLDFLGIEHAHVLGVSLGGFIAQELALAQPERLRGLVLVGTGFGGPEMIPVPPEALQRMIPDPQLSPEARVRWAMPFAFAPGYPESHPAVFEELVRLRLRQPQAPEASVRQVRAAAGFDASARLGAIVTPTLVLHGDADRVVPVENARLLAARLPHAELRIIPGGGHLVFVEQADLFNQTVLDFLSRVDRSLVEPT